MKPAGARELLVYPPCTGDEGSLDGVAGILTVAVKRFPHPVMQVLLVSVDVDNVAVIPF